MEEQELAGVAAQLYALPFDEFVPARTDAAKAAAAAGQRSLAADLRSLPKPSVAAWTVNMLAARHPETLRELAVLGQSMRAAQSSLNAAELRRLGQERRRLLGGTVKAAQAAAEHLGRKISGAVAAEVEETLRAATADAGAAAAVQSGRLLRGLSADGVDVVDLAGAVALPHLLPAEGHAPPPGAAASTPPPNPPATRPRLRAVRSEPRTTAPSATERARALLRDAETAADAAVREARELEDELARAAALAAGLADTVRELREQLSARELELKDARKRRETVSARAQQAARGAAKARRSEDLARERVLRLSDTGNTPG